VTLTEDLSEFEELATSAGFDILYEIIQRKKPGSSTFVGKGKFKMIKEILEQYPVDVLLINGDLRPKQHFNLENNLKMECLDRIAIVLRIFSEMARDRKAKLQVERARLEYEIPLLREWIHSARMGEHPGFLGGGEYQVDTYYRLIRRRKRKIDQELESINRGENVRRTHRKRDGFFLVSIAGYTNAGKSSLLRSLTDENVVVEDRMFSTLSTTTRRLKGVRKEILVSDTIGFIHDLPHFMIESFMTTIEDIFLSDLVLLVVDSSDPVDVMERKLETSKRILFPNISPGRVIITFNKIDKNTEGTMEKIWMVEESLPGCNLIPISIREGKGLDALIENVLEFFRYDTSIHLSIPNVPNSQAFISNLFDIADISSISYGDQVDVEIECRERDSSNISRTVHSLGGSIIGIGPVI
jgi:GTP-binding protein HflX